MIDLMKTNSQFYYSISIGDRLEYQFSNQKKAVCRALRIAARFGNTEKKLFFTFTFYLNYSK